MVVSLRLLRTKRPENQVWCCSRQGPGYSRRLDRAMVAGIRRYVYYGTVGESADNYKGCELVNGRRNKFWRE